MLLLRRLGVGNASLGVDGCDTLRLVGTGQQAKRCRLAQLTLLSLLVFCSACAGTASEASPVLGSETTMVSATSTARSSGNGENLTDFDREAFRRFLADDGARVPADVEQFFNQAPDDRIDEFIAETCSQLRADLSVDDLSPVISAIWQRLAADHQALLSFDEVAVAMSVSSEFFCAQQRPESAAQLDHDGAAGDLVGFRQFVIEGYEPEAPFALFIDGLSDDRLGELQQQACLLSADDENLIDFGETALNHYADQLTSVERSNLELADYVEAFISFIDWFCPDRLAPDA